MNINENKEGYSLDEAYEKESLENTDVSIAHVLPQEFPITDRFCCVTFLYCTDKNNKDGLLLYAGSRRMEELTHQGLFELAENIGVIDSETAEGHWGGHVSLDNLQLIRASHGFPGERDDQIYDKFVDRLYEKLN